MSQDNGPTNTINWQQGAPAEGVNLDQFKKKDPQGGGQSAPQGGGDLAHLSNSQLSALIQHYNLPIQVPEGSPSVQPDPKMAAAGSPQNAQALWQKVYSALSNQSQGIDSFWGQNQMSGVNANIAIGGDGSYNGQNFNPAMPVFKSDVDKINAGGGSGLPNSAQARTLDAQIASQQTPYRGVSNPVGNITAHVTQALQKGAAGKNGQDQGQDGGGDSSGGGDSGGSSGGGA